MINEFKSIGELFDRIKPALKIKVKEGISLGYQITENDIWEYLINSKWKKANNLMLSDVVDDILNLDLKNI